VPGVDQGLSKLKIKKQRANKKVRKHARRSLVELSTLGPRGSKIKGNAPKKAKACVCHMGSWQQMGVLGPRLVGVVRLVRASGIFLKRKVDGPPKQGPMYSESLDRKKKIQKRFLGFIWGPGY
jgi:hypothetical protein